MKLAKNKRGNFNTLLLILYIGVFHVTETLCDKNSNSSRTNRIKTQEFKNKTANNKTQLSLTVKMDEENNSKIAVPINSDPAPSTTISSALGDNISIMNITMDTNNSNSSGTFNFTEFTEELEEILKMTEEDLKIQAEWGGNCTAKHWDKCKTVRTWFGYYVDEADMENKEKNYEIDCFVEPVICMRNGWTVSRCHLLCMGECNKEMQAKYDKYVSHEGECKAHAHG